MRAALFIVLALACATPAQAQDPLGGLRFEDLAATRERPLFRPSRRPPPPVTAEAPAPPPAPVEKAVVFGPPPFDLIGSALGPRLAFVLLRDRATGKVERLRQGDAAEGWTVGEIASRSVKLTRDGRSQALALAAPPAAADSGPLVAGVPPAEDAPASGATILGRAQRNH